MDKITSHDLSHLPAFLLLLAAAVFIVALFKRIHVSPVLGYLVAGAAIGPGGAGIVTDVEGTAELAEFGVVFLLFLIGLELSWERLHALRRQVFAVGILQVAATAGILASLLYLSHLPAGVAMIVGGGLALSSTAFVLQIVEERGQKASQLGRLSLAMLLLQDLAVVPLLVLVPVFARHESSLGRELGEVALRAAFSMTAILIAGRILLRPFYRIVAALGSPEIFTALTLLLVLGAGWVTNELGLSMALGAFIAGLLMAETEYRHQVEADMLPFKGLFLGLFFMTVGMSADLHLLWSRFGFVLSLAAGLVAAKAAIILILCRLSRFSRGVSIQAAFLLAQGGEFAFVLFRLATADGLIPGEPAQLLILTIILTMAATPLLAGFGSWLGTRLERTRQPGASEASAEMNDIRDHVIILGFGRVGQTIAKLLSAENIPYLALDMSVATVSRANKTGLPVYYGDGARRDVLHAIGVERASAAIVTVNDSEQAEKAVTAIRTASSTLPIIARARDLACVVRLEAAGANMAVSEMFEASLQLGGSLLKSIGIADQEITRILSLFRDRDYALAQGTFEARPEERNTSYSRMVAFQQQRDQEAAYDDPMI